MHERHFNPTRLEVRSTSNPGVSAGTLVGYASVFSTPGNKFGLSEDLGGWRERVDRRAFDKVLADRKNDTFFLLNHDPNAVLSRAKNGTLKMKADYTGLRISAEVAPTSYGKDLVENVRNGNIDSMSFGFLCDQDDWGEEDIDGVKTTVRTLRSIGTLMDVSAVVYPAYSDASISASEVSAQIPRWNSLPASAPLELRSRIAEARQRSERRKNFQSLINSL